MKKAILFMILLSLAFSVTAQAKTLYDIDGVCVDAPEGQEAQYLANGYYEYPVVLVYASDGRWAVIPRDELDSYKSEGWEDSYCNMYGADGSVITVGTNQVDAYEYWGYYRWPVIWVYSEDGRSTLIYEADFDKCHADGWYRYPVTRMYTTDGRQSLIFNQEVADYEAKGWYTYPVLKMRKNDGSAQKVIPASEAGYYYADDWSTYYDQITWITDGIVYEKGYESAVSYTEEKLLGFSENDEEYHLLNKKKAELCSAWCESGNQAPLKILSYTVSPDGNSNNAINIRIRNLSYKKIASFAVSFECYDANANLTCDPPYTNGGYCTVECGSANLDAYAKNRFSFVLDQNSNTKTIKRITVTRVTYSDGETIWL